MSESKKIYSAAMRGRYTPDGIKQHLEIRSDKFTNALTTVQKDTLIVEIYRDNITREQDIQWQKEQGSEN